MIGSLLTIIIGIPFCLISDSIGNSSKKKRNEEYRKMFNDSFMRRYNNMKEWQKKEVEICNSNGNLYFKYLKYAKKEEKDE